MSRMELESFHKYTLNGTITVAVFKSGNLLFVTGVVK